MYIIYLYAHHLSTQPLPGQKVRFPRCCCWQGFILSPHSFTTCIICIIPPVWLSDIPSSHASPHFVYVHIPSPSHPSPVLLFHLPLTMTAAAAITTNYYCTYHYCAYYYGCSTNTRFAYISVCMIQSACLPHTFSL